MKTSACRLTFSTFLPGESRVAECFSVAKGETMPGSRETQRLHSVSVSATGKYELCTERTIGCPAERSSALLSLRISSRTLEKAGELRSHGQPIAAVLHGCVPGDRSSPALLPLGAAK